MFVRPNVALIEGGRRRMEFFQREGVASARPFRQRAIELLGEGEQRFRRALSERQLTPEDRAIAEGASFSASLVVEARCPTGYS